MTASVSPEALEDFTGLEILERDALIMANARNLIKAHKRTSNQRLYMELFGTGFGTARSRSRRLGCDPESNVTNYNEMMKHIRDHYGAEVTGDA